MRDKDCRQVVKVGGLVDPCCHIVVRLKQESLPCCLVVSIVVLLSGINHKFVVYVL